MASSALKPQTTQGEGRNTHTIYLVHATHFLWGRGSRQRTASGSLQFNVVSSWEPHPAGHHTQFHPHYPPSKRAALTPSLPITGGGGGEEEEGGR